MMDNPIEMDLQYLDHKQAVFGSTTPTAIGEVVLNVSKDRWVLNGRPTKIAVTTVVVKP